MECERGFMTNNEFYPCIILPGIGQSKTELTDGAGNRIKSAWPLDIDTDKLLKKKKTFYKVGYFKERCRTDGYNNELHRGNARAA